MRECTEAPLFSPDTATMSHTHVPLWQIRCSQNGTEECHGVSSTHYDVQGYIHMEHYMGKSLDLPLLHRCSHLAVHHNMSEHRLLSLASDAVTEMHSQLPLCYSTCHLKSTECPKGIPRDFRDTLRAGLRRNESFYLLRTGDILYFKLSFPLYQCFPQT